MSRGIDIYGRFQTVTDPAAVRKAGVEFAWVKHTDGNGVAAVRADRLVAQMKAARIPVGGYHFSQPGDPAHQADILLAEVRRLKSTDLPPALDLEDNPPSTGRPNIPFSQKRSWAIKFCRRVRTAAFRPAVYMSASDASKLRPDQWGIDGLVIWIAAYGTNTGAGYNPRTDPAKVRKYYPGRYDVHQFTSRGKVPGITAGGVDLNQALTSLGIVPPAKQEDDDLTPDEKRMLAELHAMLRPGKTKVQTPGVLTRELAEILVSGRKQAGVLAGIQKAQADLAATGKVDLAAVTAAAQKGSEQGASKAIDEALDEIQKQAEQEVQA